MYINKQKAAERDCFVIVPGRQWHGSEEILPGTQNRTIKRDRGSYPSVWLKE